MTFEERVTKYFPEYRLLSLGMAHPNDVRPRVCDLCGLLTRSFTNLKMVRPPYYKHVYFDICDNFEACDFRGAVREES